MTQKVNPSVNRAAKAFETAGAIALAGGAGDGYISSASNPSDLSVYDADIDDVALNAFEPLNVSSTSLTVDIDAGEAFIFGSWVVKDTTSSVTLEASTAGQTVYVGWNKDAPNDVVIDNLEGTSDFATSSTDTDAKIPIATFETDTSGVVGGTFVNERTIGKTIEGTVSKSTDNITANYTTSDEDILFVDTSGGPVTITLASGDALDGNEITIIDSGGNAETNPITISSNDNIDGSASDITIETNYGAQALVSDGTDWYTSGAGGSGGTSTITTASITDTESPYLTSDEDVIFVDSSAGIVTVTLSDADATDGNQIKIIDSGGASSTNPITIETEVAGSTPFIDDTNDSITLESDYGAQAVDSDGTDWYTSGAGAGGVTVTDESGTSVSSNTVNVTSTSADSTLAITPERVSVTDNAGVAEVNIEDLEMRFLVATQFSDLPDPTTIDYPTIAYVDSDDDYLGVFKQ